MLTQPGIQRFIDAIEAKDKYTQGHSHHVAAVVRFIYDYLPDGMRALIEPEKLFTAALLHDIGKIQTPDYVLNKEDKLDDGEWEIMKMHPKNGERIITESGLDCPGDWILYHHERLDGRGYYGLSGEEIPLEARIIAVADTFSALRTYRIYRPAKNIDETVKILREAAGTQLDPAIAEGFLSADVGLLENLECNCEICRLRREMLLAGEKIISER